MRGQDGLSIDEAGNLVVQVGAEQIVQQVPVVYQRTASGMRLIGGHYTLKGQNRVAFELGRYDQSLPLVIDPVVVYSGFLGGEGMDTAVSVLRSTDGFLYIGGNTRSVDLSTNSDAMQVSLAGDQDMFIMKIDPSLPYPDGILTLTYLGGTGYDELRGMHVNAANILYLTGTTASTDLPMAVGAYQTEITGDKDAFLIKYVPELGTGAMLYSTFIGGDQADWGNAVTTDADGNIYIAGQTASLNLTMAGNPVQGASGGKWDAWVAVFDDAGNLNYCTFLGGAGDDMAKSIALRSDGAIVIAGSTSSANFPTAGQAYDYTFHGGGDGFVAVLVPYQGLDGLVYGTYIGGSGLDDIRKIAFDDNGKLILAGYTSSTDFPIIPGAYQVYNKNSVDLFVTVLDLNAPKLLYSSYFGGKDVDVLYNMKRTASGALLLTGYTYSTDFPVTATAAQSKIGGISDAFVLRLDLSQTGSNVLQYSSFAGGAQMDNGYDVEEDASGNFFLVGNSNSRQFPAGYDAGNLFGGDYNVFVLGVQPCAVTLSAQGKDLGATGGTATFLVNAAAGCPWTVRSSSNWIKVDGTVSGVGNGQVTYEVAPNTSGIRQGSLKVFDQKHTVTQSDR